MIRWLKQLWYIIRGKYVIIPADLARRIDLDMLFRRMERGVPRGETVELVASEDISRFSMVGIDSVTGEAVQLEPAKKDPAE
jgi:hypothetical protein